MENHVFRRRRETQSEVFPHTAEQSQCEENEVSLTVQSPKLPLNGNPYSKCSYYIRNGCFLPFLLTGISVRSMKEEFLRQTN